MIVSINIYPKADFNSKALEWFRNKYYAQQRVSAIALTILRNENESKEQITKIKQRLLGELLLIPNPLATMKIHE